jgi:hypothetical protein
MLRNLGIVHAVQRPSAMALVQLQFSRELHSSTFIQVSLETLYMARFSLGPKNQKLSEPVSENKSCPTTVQIKYQWMKVGVTTKN